MRFDDIRQFIDFLDHKGDLRRISEKVSPELEITEIVDRVVKDKGPALLFSITNLSQTSLNPDSFHFMILSFNILFVYN